ncbi:hypothetical protein KKA69_01645 [Patescibacteria group bacterium]|nr:hypothetical protein [Patescibacteria group bacterium]
MTTRERQILEAIKELGGKAHPTTVGRKVGISSDYAEQLCRDLVYLGYLEKIGLHYKIKKEKK